MIYFYIYIFFSLPLAQARQTFSSMDLQLKKEFLTSLENLSGKYFLSDIMFISFNLKHGYRNKFCASDMVYALLAILEHVCCCPISTFYFNFYKLLIISDIVSQGIDSSSDDNQRFQNALDALSRCHGDILKKGIETAKKILINGGRQIQTCMESNLIVKMGQFLYLPLHSVTVFINKICNFVNFFLINAFVS